MRAYQDNVLIALEPEQTLSPGGIHLVHSCSGCKGAGYIIRGRDRIQCMTCRGSGVGKKAKDSRWAKVIASGPGYRMQRAAGARGSQDGPFVPNETKPGDRVLVDALAGDEWDDSLTTPRHNGKDGDFGELRWVRESEILAVEDG